VIGFRHQCGLTQTPVLALSGPRSRHPLRSEPPVALKFTWRSIMRHPGRQHPLRPPRRHRRRWAAGLRKNPTRRGVACPLRICVCCRRRPGRAAEVLMGGPPAGRVGSRLVRPRPREPGRRQPPALDRLCEASAHRASRLAPGKLSNRHDEKSSGPQTADETTTCHFGGLLAPGTRGPGDWHQLNITRGSVESFRILAGAELVAAT
jgi:hypothetical protein